jgi:hypothetical protein
VNNEIFYEKVEHFSHPAYFAKSQPMRLLALWNIETQNKELAFSRR